MPRKVSPAPPSSGTSARPPLPRNPLIASCSCAALLFCSLSALPARALAPVRNPDALPPAAGLAPPAGAAAQSTPEGFGPLDPAPPTGLTPDQIVARFGARESEFARALDQYTFRRTVTVDTISDDTGKPDGEYHDVTDIVLSDDGSRTEHVVFAPANTITRVIMSQNDFDDITHRLPFVLTAADLPQYDLTYLGRQKVDELDTYVFEAAPKRIEKNHRYFQGKIWVDQRDLQIVLINGKSVPDDLRRGHEDLSPPYTTYYEEIDGHYWFPVYTHADGVLHFAAQNGALANDVRIRYTVKYTDYKRFHARSRIIYNGETLAPADPNAKPGTSQPGTTQPGAAPGSTSSPASTPDTTSPSDPTGASTNPKALPQPDPDAPPLAHPAPH